MSEQSSRLRDQARTRFQEVRQSASESSTRLRDRATTTFQQQRDQIERRREQVREGREEFAASLDLSADTVRPVQLNDRGTEFGFVPTGQGRETLAEQFAAEREFVDPDDTLVEADPTSGVETRVDPERRPDVASDARQELAADDPFAQPDDLDVAVGPGGVESAGFTETGRRRRAARELETETALSEVDPQADLTETDSGLGLDRGADRRAAARRFEDELGAFQQGELTDADVRETADGFGLKRAPAREAAAARIDEQLPDVAVGPDAIELTETESGDFEASFEREVRR